MASRLKGGSPQDHRPISPRSAPRGATLVCRAGRPRGAAPSFPEAPPDLAKRRPRIANIGLHHETPGSAARARQEAPQKCPYWFAGRGASQTSSRGAPEAPQRRPYWFEENGASQKRRQTSSRGAPEARTLVCRAGRPGAPLDLIKRRPQRRIYWFAGRGARGAPPDLVERRPKGVNNDWQGAPEAPPDPKTPTLIILRAPQKRRQTLQERSERCPYGFAGRGAHISVWRLAFGVWRLAFGV